MRKLSWLLLLVAGVVVYLTVTSEEGIPASLAGSDSTAAGASAYSVRWRTAPMDNSRTGCRAASSDDVAESLGTMRGKVYVAPNGRKFRRGSTPVVAKILLAAQPRMAHLKEVIATSAREMVRDYPESELSNWFIDELMRAVADSTGRQVDVGIANFGGIRVDMPAGNVTLDDIKSMFPFRNKLSYVAMPGSELLEILQNMAATRFQVLGGMRVVARDGQLESVLVGGEPLDVKKVYGVATIDFLLNGGDGLRLARNARELEILEGYVIDTILPYVRSLTAAGKPIEYQKDGRVQIY